MCCAVSRGITEPAAPMPEELLQRLIAARNFNQGFATVEYVASALVDLDLHSLRARPGRGSTRPHSKPTRWSASACRTRSSCGTGRRISPHMFSGGGYAAAYYSYMWSEVLDADAFEAFEETGDIFDPATAKRLRDTIYAAGGSRDPADAYKAFRGRLPSPDALLRKRGLAEPAPQRREHGRPSHCGSSPRRRLRAACRRPSKRAARSSPKAAMRSKRWSPWRRRSPWSIRI